MSTASTVSASIPGPRPRERHSKCRRVTFVAGLSYPLEVHFVHSARNGNLAVIGVLLQYVRGARFRVASCATGVCAFKTVAGRTTSPARFSHPSGVTSSRTCVCVWRAHPAGVMMDCGVHSCSGQQCILVTYSCIVCAGANYRNRESRAADQQSRFHVRVN